MKVDDLENRQWRNNLDLLWSVLEDQTYANFLDTVQGTLFSVIGVTPLSVGMHRLKKPGNICLVIFSLWDFKEEITIVLKFSKLKGEGLSQWGLFETCIALEIAPLEKWKKQEIEGCKNVSCTRKAIVNKMYYWDNTAGSRKLYQETINSARVSPETVRQWRKGQEDNDSSLMLWYSLTWMPVV